MICNIKKEKNKSVRDSHQFRLKHVYKDIIFAIVLLVIKSILSKILYKYIF